MHAALTLAVAFVASVGGTAWLIGWLREQALVAVENDRTMHAGQIPQGGGAAVLAASLATALVLWPWSSWHTVLVPAAVGLGLLSAANDRREITFPWRLAAHLAAAGAALTLIPANALILGGVLPYGLDRLVALIGFCWFINLYNFMDGIDGLAGVESMSIASGALAVFWAAGVATPLGGLALSIIGASAGFLVWNWHKAQIFLGDVGSIPLGFLLGALLLYLATTVSLTAALILPLYYLTDATLTLARRFQRGDKVWQPHRAHAYQRAARAVGSHSHVVERIAACNAVLIAAAVLALNAPILALLAAAIAVAILMWTLETLADPAIPR